MRELNTSEIEWLNNTPKHWEIGKAKHYYTFFIGVTPESKYYLYYDNDYSYKWATITDMDNSRVIATNSRIRELFIDEFEPQITRKGSLLYSFQLSVGQVALDDRDIITNKAIASFDIDSNPNINFPFYSASLIIQNAKENIYGAKLRNQKLIQNAIIVFLPSLSKRLLLISSLVNVQRLMP